MSQFSLTLHIKAIQKVTNGLHLLARGFAMTLEDTISSQVNSFLFSCIWNP